MSAFIRASRKKARLRVGISGPAGSGKTYSALMLAEGIGGRIAVIDTERGSAEIYSDMVTYDVCSLSPPFSAQKYIDAINSAEREGYDVLIIDSLSHAWAGEGGLLDMHESVSKSTRSGNSYTAWAKITPLHNKLVDAILQSKCHIIVTLRTKTAYDLTDRDGKKTPVKVGLAPIFRDGLEYELTTFFDMSIDGHIATTSKDRTGLFDGMCQTPTVETGRKMMEWLNSGAEPAPKEDVTPLSNELAELVYKTNTPQDVVEKWLEKANVSTFNEMPSHVLKSCIKHLQAKDYNLGIKETHSKFDSLHEIAKQRGLDNALEAKYVALLKLRNVSSIDQLDKERADVLLTQLEESLSELIDSKAELEEDVL